MLEQDSIPSEQLVFLVQLNLQQQHVIPIVSLKDGLLDLLLQEPLLHILALHVLEELPFVIQLLSLLNVTQDTSYLKLVYVLFVQP